MKLASVENMSKVPPLLVSFDLETTGRFPRYDEPISFGMAVFRDGRESPGEHQHFLICPDRSIDPGASAVHGWTKPMLLASKNSDKDLVALYEKEKNQSPISYIPKSHVENNINGMADRINDYDILGEVGASPFYNREEADRQQFEPHYRVRRKQSTSSIPPLSSESLALPPAFHSTTGLQKIVKHLSDMQKQGAVWLGANNQFDMDIIENTWARQYPSIDLASSGLMMGKLKRNNIDVLSLEKEIDSRYPASKLMPRYRLVDLADHYGIVPGGHSALPDSVTAARVFLEGQVPRIQAGIESRGPQGRVSFKFVGESGIDFSRLGPHNDKGQCGSCMHFDEILSQHVEGGNQKMIDLVNTLMKSHKI